MNKTEQFEQTINQKVDAFCKQLQSYPAELYDPIKYILSHPAKRVRPVMVLLGCDLFSDSIEKAIPAALGIELFHNFTLMHDDVMDNAPMRRGQPTVQQKWNNNVAILSGDGVFAKSVELISQTDSPAFKNILGVFTNTAIQVCEGQQMDMNYERIHKISVTQYLRMIELKTAVLLAASFKIGALAGGAKEEDAQRVYEFGKNMGIAFQLQDDILDVYSDEKKFGKQKGGDIIANKKTFLLVKAMEIAVHYVSEELGNWIFAPTFEPKDKIAAVTNIYNQLNIKKIAEAEVQKYYQKALSCLDTIPINDVKKQELTNFTDKLIKREK